MNHVLKSTLVKTSIALACITSISSYSQTIDKSINDEIIVTAKGNQTLNEALFTTHLFTESDIQAAQVKDIPALLDTLPGISVTNSGGRGTTTSVFIRGTSNGQSIVLVDGVRVGSATLGSAALNSYPIEAIERIEVIKGPFSGIYGADATGGVIQIFTKKGDSANTGVASVSYGSDSLKESNLSLNIGNKKHSFHISVHDERTNGINRIEVTPESLASDSDIADIDAFEEQAININGKTTLFNDTTTVQLSLLASESKVEIDNDFFGGTENESDNLNIALNVTSQLTEKLKLSSIYGYNDNDSVTDTVFIDDNGDEFESRFRTKRESYGAELNYTFNDTTNLTFGADYYKEDIDDAITLAFSFDTFTFVPSTFDDTERRNKGIYTQFITAIDSFSFVSSFRYDTNSDYGTETNGSIALGYKFNDNLRTTLSFGTSFEAPSFNDLFFPGFGNPDAQPEESESFELSFIGSLSNIDWQLSLYRTDFENLIVAEDTAINIPVSHIQGGELQVSTNIHNWNLGLNIDILSSENEGTGLRLSDRADETFSLFANTTIGKLDLSFNIKIEEDRFEVGAEERRLPSYALFDVAAVYNFNENLSLSGNLDNIFDKNYVVNTTFITGNPQFNTEGRQAKISLRYSF